MDHRSVFVSATCIALFMFAVTFNSPSSAQGHTTTARQSLPFTYVFMNDPQPFFWPRPWVPGSCDEDDDGLKSGEEEGTCANEKENADRAKGLRDILDLTNWPTGDPDVMFTSGSVSRPEAIIINGDLTMDWNQKKQTNMETNYQDTVNSFAVLPGLGNHDYSSDKSDETLSIPYTRKIITEQRSPNFPAYWITHYSEGSMAYAWERGNYVFIQLHNHPDYKSDDPSYPISRSRNWLEDRLAEATAAGKYVVLNSHYDFDDTKMSSDVGWLKSALRDSSVVAHFRGHYYDGDCSGLSDPMTENDDVAAFVGQINEFGTNIFGDKIPVFQAGHAGACGDSRRKALLVEFGPTYMTVAGIKFPNGVPDWFVDDKNYNKSPGLGLYSNSDEIRYKTWEFDQTASASPGFNLQGPAHYGFVAIGVPMEDFKSRATTEVDAGLVDILYWNDLGHKFGGRWTQNNLGPTAVEGNDQHGRSVAIGDFNGDGFPDLAAGAPFEDGGGADSGLVSIVYGTESGLHGKIQKLDQSSYGGNREADDQFGSALAVGDFDGDGLDDLAVSAPYEDLGCGNNAGSIHVFYGRQDNILDPDGPNDQNITLNDISSGDCEADSWMGLALAAGDFDADGDDDLVVGVPGNDRTDGNGFKQANAGYALVFDGGTGGIKDSRVRKIGQEAKNDSNIEVGDEFASALAAGDFNGDGFDDLAAGSPLEDVNCNGEGDDLDGIDAGNVFIFYGASNSIRNSSSVKRIDARDVDSWSCEADVKFGASLAAGDFNRDGFDELAVGAPERDKNLEGDTGVVVVFDGRANGITGSKREIFHQETINSCTRGCDRAASDKFGSVLAAGDADVDGYDDLAVGAPNENTSDGNDTGVVHLFYGSGNGLRNSDVDSFDQDSSRLHSYDRAANDRFGQALAITPRSMTRPIVDLGADQTVNEGSTVTLSATIDDPDPLEAFTYTWLGIQSLPTSVTPCSPDYGPNPAIQQEIGTNTTFSFTPKEDCVYTLGARVRDLDGLSDFDGLSVTVNNAAPSLDPVATKSVGEGATVNLDVSFSDPGTEDRLTLTVDWGDGSPSTVVNSLSPSASPQRVSHVYTDDAVDGTSSDDYVVTFNLEDDDGAAATAQDTIVTVNNRNPDLNNLSITVGAEGEVTTVAGDASDVGEEALMTLTIDWGDRSTDSEFLIRRGDSGAFSLDHVYSTASNSEYPVSVSLVDDDGGGDYRLLYANVTNTPPRIDSLTTNPVDEGSTATLTGTMFDPGTTGNLTVTVDWGDNQTSTTTYAAGTTDFTDTHIYQDGRSTPYEVTVTVSDGRDDSAPETANQQVNNVAPKLETFTSDQVAEGELATIAGTFSDAGTDDTHTITIDWGEGAPVTYPEIPAGTTTFSYDFTYSDNRPDLGPYLVHITVADDDGGSDTNTSGVFVSNAKPVISATFGDNITEATVAQISGSFNDPGVGDSFLVRVDWGDGTPVESASYPSGSLTFLETHLYDDDAPSGTSSDDYTVTITVEDDDGASSDPATATVTVANSQPQLAGLTNSGPYDESALASISGTYSDTGTLDTHTVVIDWGDGSEPDHIALVAGGSAFSAEHTFTDDNPTGTGSDDFTVRAYLLDDDTGRSHELQTIVTVNNVAPAFVDVAVTSETENSQTILSGTFSDSSIEDSFMLKVNWGDGSSDTYSYGAGATEFLESHVYLDDSPSGTAADSYSIDIQILDDDGGSDSATLETLVSNAPPSLTALSASDVDENGTTSLTGTFTDATTEDTYTVTINWGEGSPEVLQLPAGSTAFNATHQYLDDNPTGTDGDVYTIHVEVADDDLGSDGDSVPIQVFNVAPDAAIESVVDQLTGRTLQFVRADGTLVAGQMNVVLRGTTIMSAGSYSDVGTEDLHYQPSAPDPQFDWGDGSSDSAAISSPDGSSSGTTNFAAHRYASDLTPDGLVIGLTITDDDMASTLATAEVELVDAEGGLVDVIADLQDLLSSGVVDASAQVSIQAAIDAMGPDGAIGRLREGKLKGSAKDLEDALADLKSAETQDSALDLLITKTQLTLSLKSMTENAIDRAADLAVRANDVAKVEAARAARDLGDSRLQLGDFAGSLDAYKDAVAEIEKLL